MQRLYADNAATSHPKPPGVLEAMCRFAEQLGASAGRGAYREAVEAGAVVSRCRQNLARLFNAVAPQHIVFGLNCSDMLNLALHGLLSPGDHAVASRMDHNSVLRPLSALQERGVQVTLVPADPVTGRVDPRQVAAALRPNTRLVALLHASNVTGTVQPIGEIAQVAHRHGALFLVDAAQTAGHLPIDVRALELDLLAFPGHKGLLGPLGTGGLYIRPGVEARLRPLRQGGTGSASEEISQPAMLPDRYECGSQNAIGLAGLAAAVQWILDRGIESLARHDRSLSARFLAAAAEIEGLRIIGPARADERVAVFSVRIEGIEPAELSALLETEFGILTRSGIHCAPLAHELLGTRDAGGTTRLSFGALSTEADVDRCAAALAEVAATAHA